MTYYIGSPPILSSRSHLLLFGFKAAAGIMKYCVHAKLFMISLYLLLHICEAVTGVSNASPCIPEIYCFLWMLLCVLDYLMEVASRISVLQFVHRSWTFPLTASPKAHFLLAVLSATSKPILDGNGAKLEFIDQVKVTTVLGSTAPPVTVKIIQATSFESKSAPIIENQVLYIMALCYFIWLSFLCSIF